MDLHTAIVEDGIVTAVWSAPDLEPPDGAVSVNVEAGTVGIGFSYADGAFAPPAAALLTPAELADYARDKRWRVEIAGIEAGGAQIATDDRSKTMILGARLAAQADPDWTTIWQSADGAAYPVDAAAIIAISDAVQAHVNATFVALAAVLAGITAGTVTTTAEVDAAFAG